MHAGGAVSGDAVSMIDFSEVERILCNWAKRATGMEAVFVEENGPQMDRPFVAFSYLDVGVIGDDGYIDSDDGAGGVSRSYYGSRTAVIDVQVYTESNHPKVSARYECERLKFALESDLYLMEVFDADVFAVIDYGATRNLPLLEDNVRFKSRAGFDLTLSLAGNAVAAETYPSITAVALSGTIYGAVSGALTGSLLVSATA